MSLSRSSASSPSTSYGTRWRSIWTRPPSAVDHAVLGPVGDADLLRPPLAERLADAARVDDHGLAEAAQHLEVRVTADEHRRRAALEHLPDVVVGRRREDPVRERAGRAVEAQRLRAVLERKVERRHERAHERLVLVGQLAGPPAADLVEHDPDRVVGRREAGDRPGVPVAEDHRAAELLHPRQAFVRLRPEADVAQADDLVDLAAVRGRRGRRRARTGCRGCPR